MRQPEVVARRVCVFFRIATKGFGVWTTLSDVQFEAFEDRKPELQSDEARKWLSRGVAGVSGHSQAVTNRDGSRLVLGRVAEMSRGGSAAWQPAVAGWNSSEINTDVAQSDDGPTG